MTWPEVAPTFQVMEVLQTRVIIDQDSGMLAKINDLGAFVLSHREDFSDIDDAAAALGELFAVDVEAIRSDLELLSATLEELREENVVYASPMTERRGVAPAGLASPRSFRIDGLGSAIEIVCHGEEFATILGPLLASHPPAASEIGHRFEIWRSTRVCVAEDGFMLLENVGLTDAVMGLLTSVTAAVLKAERRTLLVHAAAVADSGNSIVLGGGPNAGKSTTTIELMERGFNYLTDEIVELDPASGSVAGFSRPIGLEGPVRQQRPHLRPFWIDDVPHEPRWPVAPSMVSGLESSGRIRLFALLEFAADGDDTTIRVLEPIESLAHICRLVFNRSQLTEPNLRALGELLRKTPSILVRHTGAARAAEAILQHYRQINDDPTD